MLCAGMRHPEDVTTYELGLKSYWLEGAGGLVPPPHDRIAEPPME
jgi:hypothetical protein